MLLLDARTGDPMDVRVRVRDRISTWLHADRLDGELARGASPDSTLELALRARSLTSNRTRRTLATGLNRVIREASSVPSIAGGTLPFDRRSVLTAAPEIQELREELLASGPVSVQGVALARTLLTNGDVHRRDLRPLVREARGGLELCLA
jgi:hypothetical protein